MFKTIDVLFLVDTTSSMDPYIDMTKVKINSILDKIKEKYPKVVVRIGFLGYKDHCDKNQFE